MARPSWVPAFAGTNGECYLHLCSLRLPPGCMVTQGALACGQGSEIIKQELASSRNNFVSVLTARFARAKAENDLPADADPAALARLLATMHQGLAVQAASGASEEELLGVARLALESWPGKRD